MRKQDIKPGVLYAYRNTGAEGSMPLVFLSSQSWVGSLWRATRSGERAFVLAASAHRPQAGHVHNNGSVGYPAVAWAGRPDRFTDEDRERLLAVRFDDFRTASGTQVPGFPGAMFLVVTATVRVTGPWDPEPAPKEG